MPAETHAAAILAAARFCRMPKNGSLAQSRRSDRNELPRASNSTSLRRRYWLARSLMIGLGGGLSADECHDVMTFTDILPHFSRFMHSITAPRHTRHIRHFGDFRGHETLTIDAGHAMIYATLTLIHLAAMPPELLRRAP